MAHTTEQNFFPPSERVNTSVLMQLFKNTQNSYKYLLFLAIIRMLKRYEFNRILSLEELQAEMLTIAWYPHTFFKLSFGSQDQISQSLDSLPELIVNSKSATNYHLSKVTNHIKNNIDNLALMKYVPYRLIRGFFSKETHGLDDQKVNKVVYELAKEYFDEYKPLYYINKDKKILILHTDWLNYLFQNITIIEEWALWEWLLYMQSKNPSTPNLSSKLLPPPKRSALKEQKDFWIAAIKGNRDKIRCPYSNEKIDTDNFALDHFLPWSFVVHDRLWNLVPTIPEINLHKSDNLPSEKYIYSLTQDHFYAINRIGNDWSYLLESYYTDLHISDGSISSFDIFYDQYSRNIHSMLSLAKAQGFASDWEWS